MGAFTPFCLGWGSPGNGLELFFAFVSSFDTVFVSSTHGTFWPKSDPLLGV